MSDYYLICTGCGHKDEAPFDVGDVCPWCDNGKLVDEYSYNAGRQLGRKEGMREAADMVKAKADPLPGLYTFLKNLLYELVNEIRKAAGETK